MDNRYRPVIGLEIHVQLNTKTKAFCDCSAEVFDLEPNSSICPVCTGQPGALPVPSHEMFELGIKIASALNCSHQPLFSSSIEKITSILIYQRVIK